MSITVGIIGNACFMTGIIIIIFSKNEAIPVAKLRYARVLPYAQSFPLIGSCQ